MEFFDIILIGMIAAFVLLRLRSELGNKTGNEHQPPAPPRPNSGMGKRTMEDILGTRKEERAPDHTVIAFEADPAVRGGLSDIQRADARFNPVEFLGGAKSAYRMILEAFWMGDRNTLKDFLSDEVFSQFEGAINVREESGHTLDNRLLDIDKVEISEAVLNGRVAELTITFGSEIIAVTRDKDGNPVEGNLSETIRVNDIWTFARSTRSREPNWTLIATRTG